MVCEPIVDSSAQSSVPAFPQICKIASDKFTASRMVDGRNLVIVNHNNDWEQLFGLDYGSSRLESCSVPDERQIVQPALAGCKELGGKLLFLMWCCAFSPQASEFLDNCGLAVPSHLFAASGMRKHILKFYLVVKKSLPVLEGRSVV